MKFIFKKPKVQSKRKKAVLGAFMSALMYIAAAAN